MMRSFYERLEDSAFIHLDVGNDSGVQRRSVTRDLKESVKNRRSG